MDTRAATFALVALTSGVLAAVGFALTAWLDAFAPCRMVYRMPQAVYGSLACQSYAALTLFSLLLAGVAGVLGVVVGLRHCGKGASWDR